MVMALIALIGVFVSLYLTLYKLGYIGTLVCGTGSCELVQLSKWGTFLGLPVAAWGVGSYGAVFVLALASTQERFESSRRLTGALALLTAWGVLFTIWLTYLELAVIHAICRWCVGSAVMTVLLFVLAVAEWRSRSAEGAVPSAEAQG
jgi:uncharacterized membrane protein